MTSSAVVRHTYYNNISGWLRTCSPLLHPLPIWLKQLHLRDYVTEVRDVILADPLPSLPHPSLAAPAALVAPVLCHLTDVPTRTEQPGDSVDVSDQKYL
nr:hypothetical protein BgiMline_022025 [Biomphalaria glabrata]